MFILNRLWEKRIKAENILRRLKDIASRLNDPQDFRSYLDNIIKNNGELNKLADLLPLETGLKNDRTCVFGHFDELHERIAGENSNFIQLVDRLKNKIAACRGSVIKIGVTRYNFFCIDKIVMFCLSLKGIEDDPGLPVFDVFPVDKIVSNFIEYISLIKQKIGHLGIKIILCDEGFFEILQIIQFHAQRGKVFDKELVRMLGVISEHAFIGPQTMVFDPFHRCNIKCKHCFVHNPVIRHPEGFLDRKFDLGIFKNIINDAVELKVDSIILQGDGEPLLYNNFFDMLRYAGGKGIGVSFFTNGSLITEEKAKEIVDLGIKEIYCSFPAGTPATYGVVTTTGTGEIFNVIVKNLKTLMRIKRQGGKQAPRLIMTHVIHTLNHHELIDMAKIDAEIQPDASRFYLIRLDNNNKPLKLKDEELKVIRRDLPVASRIFKENNIEFVDNILFQLDHYDNSTGAWSKDVFLKEGCTVGWYFCLIPALYDASMCCHLRTVGYLNKQSFKELWNSRAYRTYRIKAKFLNDNRDFAFLNGVKLYDEHCDHCDNHQTLITTLENLHKFGLYGFFKK